MGYLRGDVLDRHTLLSLTLTRNLMPVPAPLHVQLVEPLLKASDYISIAAILLGPVIAIQLQKFIERNSEAQRRREDIFKTLMATRGSTLSMAHVEALNRIDLEFSNDKKYKRTIEAWKEYFDNLADKNDQNNSNQLAIWSAQNSELRANLLYEMGLSLGYKFDKSLIKRNIYSPIGHGQVEQENDIIRRGIANIFGGDGAVPFYVVQDEESAQRQQDLQDLMIAYYTPQAKETKADREEEQNND